MEENKNLENNEQVINPVSDVVNAPVVEMPAGEAPVVEAAPVVEMPAEVAPVVEAAPVVEMPAEVAPVVEPTPVVEETPVVEMPADVAPVVEATPVVEMPAEVTPVVEATPVVEMPTEAAPVVEAAPVADVTPVVEPTAVVGTEPTPAVEGTQPTEPAPATAEQGTAPAAAPVEEKKRSNTWAIIAIILCVIIGVVYFLTKDKDKKPTPTPTPNPAPVVTPSDNGNGDNNDNTQNNDNNQQDSTADSVNHEKSTANKYTLVTDGKTTTLYLKPTSNTFYYVEDSQGCLSGNYGTYAQTDNTITLSSSLYFGCDSCYHSSASTTMSANALQTYTFTSSAEVLDLTSANQEVFTSVGTEEVGNPFYNENVKSCDSQENAN